VDSVSAVLLGKDTRPQRGSSGALEDEKEQVILMNPCAYSSVCAATAKERDALLATVVRRETEIMKLREALEELVDIIDDKESRSEIDSFTTQPARAALGEKK
jgi:hypothetical protein